MAQQSPNYEEVPEILDIADRLIDKYPEIYGGIHIDRISAFAITNKDRKDDSKPIWAVMPIKSPVNMLCNKDYIITVFANSYEELSEKHKAAMVADCLNAIPVEGDGKVNAKDLKEYAVMIRTLGVDFMDNPDIPDLLAEDVDWVRK